MPKKRMTTRKTPQEFSEDTKSIITVLLLLFAFPVGFVLMWVWTKWPRWVKILITLPIIIFFLLMFLLGVFLVKNAGKIHKEFEYRYSATSSSSLNTY